jgi:hypothetical protein
MNKSTFYDKYLFQVDYTKVTEILEQYYNQINFEKFELHESYFVVSKSIYEAYRNLLINGNRKGYLVYDETKPPTYKGVPLMTI